MGSLTPEREECPVEPQERYLGPAARLALSGSAATRLAGESMKGMGLRRLLYARSTHEMSQAAEQAIDLGMNPRRTADLAHKFRNLMKEQTRESDPALVRRYFESRNQSVYGDALSPGLDTYFEKNLSTLRKLRPELSEQELERLAYRMIATSAGRSNIRANVGARILGATGPLLEVAGDAAFVANAGTHGYQIGTGIDEMTEGKTALGVTDTASGTASLVVDLAAAGEMAAGATAATVGAAAIFASSGIMAAEESVRAAIQGKKTPLEHVDDAFKAHGVNMNFSDLIGWFEGEHPYRRPPLPPEHRSAGPPDIPTATGQPTIDSIGGYTDLPNHQAGGVTTKDHIAMVHKNEAIIPLQKAPEIFAKTMEKAAARGAVGGAAAKARDLKIHVHGAGTPEQLRQQVVPLLRSEIVSILEEVSATLDGTL